MSTQAKLQSAMTRLIDESPCSYEEVISILIGQLAWMYRARADEHGGRKVSRRQILEGLTKLSNEGKL